MHLSIRRKAARAINHVGATAGVISVVLSLQCIHPGTHAQHLPKARRANQSHDERVRQILGSLEPGNMLRFALERGDRGSGVHYGWMDKMRREGVKQASFRIRFHWGSQGRTLEITDTKYLRRYYRFDTAIDDPSTIEQIRAGGLEQELRNEISRRAEEDLSRRTRDLGSGQICGTLYLNLLDDEVLPLLDEPADYDDDCDVLLRCSVL